MEYVEVVRALGLTAIIISVGFLFHLKHYEKWPVIWSENRLDLLWGCYLYSLVVLF